MINFKTSEKFVEFFLIQKSPEIHADIKICHNWRQEENSGNGNIFFKKLVLKNFLKRFTNWCIAVYIVYIYTYNGIFLQLIFNSAVNTIFSYMVIFQYLEKEDYMCLAS
jgi:hypothetical protein